MLEPNKRRMRIALVTMMIGISSAFAICPPVSAHEGPPFPILMDRPLAEHVVSVWADPDIGEATFFIVVESPSGGMPREVPSVSMWVEPVSGRLERVQCETKRQALRNRMQFEAHPHFDQRDAWTIGFRLTSARGDFEELTTQIESTPPGFGLWDFAIYLFPFLLLGGMWVLATIRRRRMEYPQTEYAESECDGADSDQEVETEVEYRV